MITGRYSSAVQRAPKCGRAPRRHSPSSSAKGKAHASGSTISPYIPCHPHRQTNRYLQPRRKSQG